MNCSSGTEHEKRKRREKMEEKWWRVQDLG